MLSDAGQELAGVGTGELPVVGPGHGIVVLLEDQDLDGKLVQVLEVVGTEQRALDDGEVDLDLVQLRRRRFLGSEVTLIEWQSTSFGAEYCNEVFLRLL